MSQIYNDDVRLTQLKHLYISLLKHKSIVVDVEELDGLYIIGVASKPGIPGIPAKQWLILSPVAEEDNE